MQSAIRNPQSAIFIVGPTAVGKSDVAVELATRIDAEILNADAFQLYAGLDLLTAKTSAENLARVRHHLVGTFALSESMSVARFLEAARMAVAEIRKRGRAVIVVGGTGLYVRALTHGLTPGPASDRVLREKLTALSLSESLEQLKKLDAPAYERVDRRNPRRVQRALETAMLRSAPNAESGNEAASSVAGIIEPTANSWLGLFLQRERAELHHRIDARTDEMFRRGLLAEVAATKPESVGPTAAQMIGWRECLAVMRGESTEREARDRINAATRQYAKRQITWFKRETAFHPLMLAPRDSAQETATRIAADWTQLKSS